MMENDSENEKQLAKATDVQVRLATGPKFMSAQILLEWLPFFKSGKFPEPRIFTNGFSTISNLSFSLSKYIFFLAFSIN